MNNLEKLKGKFISFEGVEGAGKSTQSKLLVEYLNKNSIKAVWTREPGGSEGAEEIRKVIMLGGANQWDGITELLLMSAARRDHTEKKIKRQGVITPYYVYCRINRLCALNLITLHFLSPKQSS